MVRYYTSGAKFFSPSHGYERKNVYRLDFSIPWLGRVDIKSVAEIVRDSDELLPAQKTKLYVEAKEEGVVITPAEIMLDNSDSAKDSSGMCENADEERAAQEKASEYEKLFRERFDYQYPYARIGALPAKITVSHLYPDSLDEDLEPSADIDIDTDVDKSVFSDTIHSPAAVCNPFKQGSRRSSPSRHSYSPIFTVLRFYLGGEAWSRSRSGQAGSGRVHNKIRS